MPSTKIQHNLQNMLDGIQADLEEAARGLRRAGRSRRDERAPARSAAGTRVHVAPAGTSAPTLGATWGGTGRAG